MRLGVFLGIGICLAVGACGEGDADGDETGDAAATTCRDDQTYAKVARPFFEGYCLTCHSEATSAAGGGHAFESLGEVREHGHVMREYLEDKTMPPANAPKQPSEAERQAMIDFLVCSGAAEGGQGHTH